MAKTDNLKLSITVDNNPVYFNSPVFWSHYEKNGEYTFSIQTDIGNQVKQKIVILIKNLTYVEPVVETESILTK